MASSGNSGWDDLTPDEMAELDRDAFEEFCGDLVHFEATDRHDRFTFDGPAGEAVPDGGRDILLEVTRAPLTSRTDYQRQHHVQPITEDEIAQTAYSCKSGDNWLDLERKSISGRKEPGRTVEVLLRGGCYKLLINVRGKLDQTLIRDETRRLPKEHLVAALHERMRELDRDADAPTNRVEILDANYISSFLRGRRPEGLDRWLDRLSLGTVLHDFHYWTKLHKHDRKLPPYFPDPLRKELQTRIVDFLRREVEDPSQRVAWIVGAPGCGKTRLLWECLNDSEDLGQRVRYSADPGEVRARLSRRELLSRHPNALVVVDDCPLQLVDVLATDFVAQCESGFPHARLVVLTPMSPHSVEHKGVPRVANHWPLQSLEKDASTTLVSYLTGEPADSETVAAIVRLSEGYPWYASLLADATREGSEPPATPRQAAMLGLASDAEEQRVPGTRRDRGRALFAASISKQVDWRNDLDETQRQTMARSVGLQSFEALHDLAQVCIERGTLRSRRGWAHKYVTPLVLEREILEWMLEGDGGDDPGGGRLREFAPERLGDLHEALLRFDLPAEVLVGLADGILSDLEGASGPLAVIADQWLFGSSLLVAARCLPYRTAHELKRRVEATGIDELVAVEGGRRYLVWALEELASRASAFEDAESSLFRLALAENEPYANNATGVWTGLFSVGINVTHRSIAERLDLLYQRLHDQNPGARHLALKGLQACLDERYWRTVPEARDGDWPEPTQEESRAARERAWSLLASRFDDPEADVAAAARKMGIDTLRQAVRLGVGEVAMDLIASRVGTLTDIERTKLSDMLEAVRRYDVAFLDPTGKQPAALEHLLAPRTYRERLLHRIGSWKTDEDQNQTAQADESLAREGLDDDRPVLEELDLLLSDEAVRAHVFAIELGKQDQDGLLLGALKERSAQGKGSTFLANYLWGVKNGGRSEQARQEMRNLAGAPEHASALSSSLVRLGATDEDLRTLVATVEAGWLEPAQIMELGRGSAWLEGVQTPELGMLFQTLLGQKGQEGAAAVLELSVDLIKRNRAQAGELVDFLLQSLDRLSHLECYPMTEYYFGKGAKILVDQGETARVAELAVLVLSSDRLRSRHGWQSLQAVVDRDPKNAWLAIAKTLEREDRLAGQLLLEFGFNRDASIQLPTTEVLTWVGQNSRRGRMVAALIRPHDEELHPILRALVQRFGASSSVAVSIVARVHNTNGLVSSLATHDENQLQNARKWVADADPEVSRFAKRLVTSLEDSYEEHQAFEEFERREMGG